MQPKTGTTGFLDGRRAASCLTTAHHSCPPALGSKLDCTRPGRLGLADGRARPSERRGPTAAATAACGGRLPLLQRACSKCGLGRIGAKVLRLDRAPTDGHWSLLIARPLTLLTSPPLSQSRALCSLQLTALTRCSGLDKRGETSSGQRRRLRPERFAAVNKGRRGELAHEWSMPDDSVLGPSHDDGQRAAVLGSVRAHQLVPKRYLRSLTMRDRSGPPLCRAAAHPRSPSSPHLLLSPLQHRPALPTRALLAVAEGGTTRSPVLKGDRSTATRFRRLPPFLPSPLDSPTPDRTSARPGRRTPSSFPAPSSSPSTAPLLNLLAHHGQGAVLWLPRPGPAPGSRWPRRSRMCALPALPVVVLSPR